MKRFFTLFSLVALVASNLLVGPFTQAFSDPTDDGDRPYLTNHFPAGAYLNNVGESLIDVKVAAKDDGTDIDFQESNNLSVLYFGMQTPFDGVSFDFPSSDSARGGSYIMEYWNGSSWTGFSTGDTTENLANESHGSFHTEWTTRPSNWTARTLTSTTGTSESLYFARIRITSEYDSDIVVEKIGITNYNLSFNLKTESGAELTDNLDSALFTTDDSLGADAFFAYRIRPGSKHQFALQTANQTVDYDYELSVDGYVTETGSKSTSKTATSVDTSFDYAYVATVQNSSGSRITGATVEAGSSYNVDCVDLGNGRYGCPVSTDDTSKKLRVIESGYNTLESTFDSYRNSNDDGQVSKTFTLTSTTTTTTTTTTHDDADLKVNDLVWESDQDFVVKIQNIGDEDVDDNFEFEVTVEEDGDETIYTYEVQDDGDVYFIEEEDDNGHRTTKNTKVDEISNDEISANSTQSINLGDSLLSDEDQDYTVTVEVDSSDDIDEEVESNNTREEDFNGDGDVNGVDLIVKDLKLEEDNDLIVVLENQGDEDVRSGTEVVVKVYVDGKLEDTFSKTSSSTSTNFTDAGETENINLGDNIVDEDDDNYTVKVTVDTEDDVDEENENNNTRSEDEDDLAKNGSNGGNVPECDGNDAEDTNFKDIENHFAECEIAYLYENDVVQGRSYSRFDPYSGVTRAEFLKMALEAAGYDVEPDSSEYFRDVRSYDWFYDYVTFASAEGLVEGYTNDTFRPNSPINRAEALQMIMNIFDVEVDNYSTDDNPFRDIRVSDWFYDPVVQGYEDGIVEGVNDDYYRPSYAISRGESAAMIYRAIDVYGEVDGGSNNSSNKDKADLRVVDIEVDEDNGDLIIELENIGDESVDSDEKVYVKIYADNHLEHEFYKTNTSSKSFLDKGERQTLNLGDVLSDYENDGDVDVKVVVDSRDDIDEDSESNNTRTETVDFDDVNF